MGNMTDAEKIRANRNNTSNIRNAARVAGASGVPHLMAAGKALQGVDKLTGGKGSETLGKAMTHTNNAIPGGSHLQNASNKLGESGVGNAIGKAADLKNGQKSQTPANLGAPRQLGHNQTEDPANQRLGDSSKRRGRFFHNIGKRNKGLVSGLDNSTDNNNDSSQDTGSPLQDSESKVGGKFGKILIIKTVAIALIVGIFVLLLFIPAVAVASFFGVNVATIVPMVSSNTYGTKNFEAINEKGTKAYEYEIAYYEKLNTIKRNYALEHGEELKAAYIHKILINIFYESDKQEVDEDGKNVIISFRRMSNMLDTVIALMTPSEEGKTIDYSKNGEFYNKLKDSPQFRNYYQDVIDKRKKESKKNITTDEVVKEILDEIFDEAKEIDGIDFNAEKTVMTGEIKVSVTDKENNNKQESTKTLNINEYLADSIYANTNSISNGELVKAYTVVYSTNIVAENKNLSITSNTVSMNNQICSTKEGCSYDKNGKLISGSGDRSNNNSTYYNGNYYYKTPLSSAEAEDLNKNISSVFGNVLVNKDGTYPKLDTKIIGGLGDSSKDYKNIITSSYGSDLSYKNVGEDNYILDGNYGYKKVLTDVIFYDQKDYPNARFCGLNGYSIAKSGCGVTSMAMVASTYENDRKYDPVYMNNEATRRKMCGGGDTGTKQAFFGQMAKAMRYKYIGGSKYDKSLLNQVLKHLSQGHLVVVRMGPGHFTSGGHYMVLGGVDPETKKVYVYDPNNRSNKSWYVRRTGNGWYSFNDIIVKEAFNFYIIWKG